MLIFFLITQIGLKAENLILSDIGKYYAVPFLLSEVSGETGNTNSGSIDVANTAYVFTEILGGYAFGGIGFLVMLPISLGLMGGNIVTDSSGAKSFTRGMVMLEGGATAVGSVCGVSLAGKIVKEKGSVGNAMTGAFLVLLECWLAGYLNNNLAVFSMALIPIGAVIGYNL